MSQTQSYSVTGMTCGHCTASVTEEVQEIAGVQDVSVALETGTVTVTSAEPLDDAAVRAAVEEAGYQLTSAPHGIADFPRSAPPAHDSAGTPKT